MRIRNDYELGAADTTRTIVAFNSQINLQFDITGSNRVAVAPGVSHLLADGITPGWRYADIIGAEIWARGIPVYVSGGDRLEIEVGRNDVTINGRTYFGAKQEKSTRFPFAPAVSIECYSCTARPMLKFDGQQVSYTPPWVTIPAGWHSIEIYSPFDNIQVYYRALFDNYTITQFAVYPVRMN